MVVNRPNESRLESTTASAEVFALTSAIARGDETVFQTFYDRFQPRLFRFIIVCARGNETWAHEIVQSVMLTAASKLKPLRSEEHLWNWLTCVARQHLSKAWRRQTQDLKFVSSDAVPEQIETHNPDCQLEEHLDAAMLSLDPDDREVVDLFYYQGLSCKEIADHAGVTPKSVSSRLERARLKLRSFVKRRLHHES
jgi:RNA polymerase sigma-70 factor (ECF subfamily)